MNTDRHKRLERYRMAVKGMRNAEQELKGSMLALYPEGQRICVAVQVGPSGVEATATLYGRVTEVRTKGSSIGVAEVCIEPDGGKGEMWVDLENVRI